MHPILFQFHGFTVHSFGAAVALAMAVSLFIVEARANRYGLDKTMSADLLFTLFISGVLGARAMYALQNWSDYVSDPVAIFRIQEGGLVWYGGLFWAVLCGIFYARWRKWPVLKLADFIAPVSALAHGIGRIGCFLNGCCYGQRTSSFLGVHFPEDGYAKIPTQLYEAAGLFIISAFLFFYASKKHNPGYVLWAYLFWYGLLRFLIEFLRGDNTQYFYLTIPQWMSLGLMLPFIVILTKDRK